MSSTDIDEEMASDDEAGEVPVWLQHDDKGPIPAGDARRRLERYWELKRLRLEVDDFSGASMDWEEL